MKFTRVAQHLYRLDPHQTYYAVFKRNGQKLRHSLHTTDRKLAISRLRDITTKLDRWRHDQQHLTFGDVAERWQTTVLAARDNKPATIEDRQYHLKALYHVWIGLKTTPVSRITVADVERWKAARAKRVSPQRFNNELGTLKQILAYALREHVTLTNPADSIERVRIVRREPAIPTRQQFATIVAHLRSQNNADAANNIELLAYSGMRRDEAAALRWSDIDTTRNTFAVTGGITGTKNRESRTVPLFPALRALLDRIPRQASTTRVLHYHQCRNSLTAACAILNLPHFTHHHFRHFFASNAIEQGIDFATIAAWLGHKDRGVLVARTYGHLRQDHSQRMAEKLTFSATQVGNFGMQQAFSPISTTT